MSGPFFDKAFQRRAYEEEQKDRRRELSKLGPNFCQAAKASSKPAYTPRKSPAKDEYVPPLNYTAEEKAARKAWLKEAKASRDSRPEGYIKWHASQSRGGGLKY